MTKFGTGPLQGEIFAFLKDHPGSTAEGIMAALNMTAAQVHPVVSDGLKRNILTATEDKPRRYRFDGPALLAQAQAQAEQQSANGAKPRRKSYRRSKRTNGLETPKQPEPLEPLRSHQLSRAIAALEVRIAADTDTLEFLRTFV